MAIVKIKAKEVQRIQVLAKATWPDTFKDILSTEQIDYMLNWMYNTETLTKQIEGKYLFYIYKENNQDLGFIGLEANHEGTANLRIHKIYVLPNHQRKGIGKKLLEFATQHVAADLKQTHLHLNVNRYNNAVTFYEHLGFQVIKEEDIDIGNNFFMNDFVMQKSL